MNDEAEFQATLGRIPSGIFILTATHNGHRTGMLASWVMQAGFEPPAITVAVKHGRYVCDWLAAGRPFALNLVPESDKQLLKHFAKGFEPGQEAFDGLETQSLADIPVLAAAAGHLHCRPVGHVDSGDHRIFLAEVVGGRQTSDEKPMVHIRKSGAHY